MAGWALDLFHGRQTREHEDIEIGIPRAGFAEIRAALRDYEFDVPDDGRVWPLDSAAFDESHQTRVREPGTGIYRLDVFREPHDRPVWICRRDEAIRLPIAQIVLRTADGIPYLTPEIVLLFKSKATRDKDEADFARALPHLSCVRARRSLRPPSISRLTCARARSRACWK